MAERNGNKPSAREVQSVERRRHWVRQIGEWERSGRSQKEFCQERGLSVQTFRWWRCRFAKEAASLRGPRGKKGPWDGGLEPVPFVPVKLVDPDPREEVPLEVVIGSRWVVRIRGDFDPEVLRKVVETLEVRAC